MSPVHRETEQDRDHTPAEWNGPTEAQWTAMATDMQDAKRTLADIRLALFGRMSDGINSDGGMVGEVRRLRSLRYVAWSALVGLVGILANALADMLIGKRGGP